MKKTPKLLILAGTVLAFLFLFGIIFYNNFIKKSIYEENSQHLLSTYEQVDKTFTMFVQHNWNALSDWSNNLQYLDDAENMKTLWYEFTRRKDAWQYQDFYMFNENCDFITAAGILQQLFYAFIQLYSTQMVSVVSIAVFTSSSIFSSSFRSDASII